MGGCVIHYSDPTLFHLALDPLCNHSHDSLVEDFTVGNIGFQFLAGQHADTDSDQGVFQHRVFLQALFNQEMFLFRSERAERRDLPGCIV